MQFIKNVQAGITAVVCSVVLVMVSGHAEADFLGIGTKTGKGGSMVSGSGGSAGAQGQAPQLPRCARPIGTAALVEKDIPGLAQSGLTSPVPLIRLMVLQSGCFQVVDRGQGMARMQQERALMSGGQLQQNSNLGGGQMKAADFFITPDIIFQDQNAGKMGGGLGGLLPGKLGIVAGGLSLKKMQAETMLSITNTRTGVQEAIAQGSAEKKDLSLFGGGGGFGGLPIGAVGGGYASTDIGKIVAAAFLDSYSKLVPQVQAMHPNPASQAPLATGANNAPRATGMAAGATPTQNGLYRAISTINVRSGPSTNDAVITQIQAGGAVTALGMHNAGWWAVQTPDNKIGWVAARNLTQ